jgi:hypothetical protein
VEGSCENGNEPSGFIKRWKILERLDNWQLLKKGQLSRVSYLYFKCRIHLSNI